jgi:hypothetical protein
MRLCDIHSIFGEYPTLVALRCIWLFTLHYTRISYWTIAAVTAQSLHNLTEVGYMESLIGTRSSTIYSFPAPHQVCIITRGTGFCSVRRCVGIVCAAYCTTSLVKFGSISSNAAIALELEEKSPLPRTFFEALPRELTSK